MMDVSVIIVSFNTLQLTIQSIKSVLNEGSGLKKEIIVVDNGSTDGSVAAIRNFQFPISNFQLKIIENKSNLGFAKANNQGIKKAKGKYILLLNSDTKVKKNAIERLVDFAYENPEAGAVVPRLLNPDGSVQSSVFRLPTITRAIKQYWFGHKGLLDKYYPQGVGPAEIESAVMASFLITPKALREVGPLNENYFMYYEDLDYCRNLKQAHLKVYYLPTAEVVHYHGASGKGLIEADNQWRRLIPSSIIYHGTLEHYLFNFIIWSGQKFRN